MVVPSLDVSITQLNSTQVTLRKLETKQGEPRAGTPRMASPFRLLWLCWLVSCASALLSVPPRRRRALLRDAAALTVLPLAASAAVETPPPMESVDLSQYKKIVGGGRYADLAEGKGNEVAEGSKVSLQWVLRRSNGYYVDGSIKMLSAKSGAVAVDSNFDEQNSFLFTVGDGRAMPGIDAGVRGMRQGGKRRLVLPVKQAYTMPIDRSPGPLPDGFGPRRQIERELQRSHWLQTWCMSAARMHTLPASSARGRTEPSPLCPLSSQGAAVRGMTTAVCIYIARRPTAHPTARRDDPYNFFYFEVEATRVR